MEGAHRRLYEITQIVKGDQTASRLMDDVLIACFDFVIGDLDSGNPPDDDSRDQLMLALDRFNSHLRRYKEIPEEGLFTGQLDEMVVWAGEFTEQVFANRPD